MWAVLAACAPGSTSPVDSVPTTGTTTTDAVPTADTGGTGVTEPVGPPPPDVVAMRVAAQAAIDLVPTLSVRPCLDAWNTASADATLVCPLYVERGEKSTWVETGCSDRGGVSYLGGLAFDTAPNAFVQRLLWDPLVVPLGPEVVPGWVAPAEFGGTVEGLAMAGSGSAMRGADGVFVLSGDFESLTLVQDGLRVVFHGLRGICHSAQTTGSWVDDLDPWLFVARLEPVAGGGAGRTEVDGQIAGLVPPFVAVAYDELSYVVGDPESCALEPSGAMRLRDEDGWTYRVTFGGACDGCGSLDDGQELCLDFSALRGALASTDALVPHVPELP